jgi:hypothetical protein
VDLQGPAGLLPGLPRKWNKILHVQGVVVQACIPALGRLRQEDGKLEGNLENTVRLHLLHTHTHTHILHVKAIRKA